jgi:LysM repeat protein
MKGDPEMKTLFNSVLRKRFQHVASLAITALLALVMFTAALPQPALAATPCVAHYTVKSGDTTSKIAHIYNLTWAEIAQANNMKPSTKIKVGQSLCIPSKTSTTAKTGTMTASANGNILTVKMTGFDKRYIWNVNVNATRNTALGVFRVGRMIVPAKTSVAGAFKLPQELRTTSYLTVCVKNVITNEKICHNIFHNG